ncbi:PH domain-containing protein [Planotetraspora sp. A-T 1434]|uniref:PH domain-containing protein n=1 Tax=Planotetraspora sp. A-T 1434 TaxID=2979219 RepID=UPI0021C19366|nr:PH domain-containing protein [Planotetraspora sp. A-T 1434]MCT9930273.1 PH domain-containing protein [Planotetraspora sp. A-T 1434]
MADVQEPRHEWRVPRRITVLKAAGVAACVALAVMGDRLQVFLSGVAALGFAVLVLRDAIAPVRLAAGEDGLVVAGLAGKERVSWNDVDRIRVDSRRRYGLTTELLEIDAGDQIHLFSRFDLGESVFDVAEALMRLRP